jgi:hypothetical protein
VYQQQSFHTANYRGNQQGHDQYLRADSQQPSTYASSNVTSQYRGYQKPFQPTGAVQSFYNPNQNQGVGFNQFSNQTGQQQFTNAVSPQSYHTANYRGNQQGHDQYLRADSQQPSQSFGGNQATSSFGQAQGQNMAQFSNQTGQQQFTNAVSPQSYHTANYRGDQQGHDQYLRADSQQPSQATASFGQTGFSNAANLGQSQSFGQGQNMAQFSNQAGQQQFTNAVSPQSYHTANYRGDQQGHDQYLRADSQQPNNVGTFGANRSFNSTGFFS